MEDSRPSISEILVTSQPPSHHHIQSMAENNDDSSDLSSLEDEDEYHKEAGPHFYTAWWRGTDPDTSASSLSPSISPFFEPEETKPTHSTPHSADTDPCSRSSSPDIPLALLAIQSELPVIPPPPRAPSLPSQHTLPLPSLHDLPSIPPRSSNKRKHSTMAYPAPLSDEDASSPPPLLVAAPAPAPAPGRHRFGRVVAKMGQPQPQPVSTKSTQPVPGRATPESHLNNLHPSTTTTTTRYKRQKPTPRSSAFDQVGTGLISSPSQLKTATLPTASKKRKRDPLENAKQSKEVMMECDNPGDNVDDNDNAELAELLLGMSKEGIHARPSHSTPTSTFTSTDDHLNAMTDVMTTIQSARMSKLSAKAKISAISSDDMEAYPNPELHQEETSTNLFPITTNTKKSGSRLTEGAMRILQRASSDAIKYNNGINEIKDEKKKEKEKEKEKEPKVIGGKDWRHNSKRSPKRYNMVGPKYHGRKFGQNLIDYIDSHPESTSVAWAGKGAYVLIYDMDGLRLELNAAGYAQQNSAASLKKQLSNYKFLKVPGDKVERLGLAPSHLDDEERWKLVIFTNPFHSRKGSADTRRGSVSSDSGSQSDSEYSEKPPGKMAKLNGTATRAASSSVSTSTRSNVVQAVLASVDKNIRKLPVSALDAPKKASVLELKQNKKDTPTSSTDRGKKINVGERKKTPALDMLQSRVYTGTRSTVKSISAAEADSGQSMTRSMGRANSLPCTPAHVLRSTRFNTFNRKTPKLGSLSPIRCKTLPSRLFISKALDEEIQPPKKYSTRNTRTKSMAPAANEGDTPQFDTTSEFAYYNSKIQSVDGYEDTMNDDGPGTSARSLRAFKRAKSPDAECEVKKEKLERCFDDESRDTPKSRGEKSIDTTPIANWVEMPSTPRASFSISDADVVPENSINNKAAKLELTTLRPEPVKDSSCASRPNQSILHRTYNTHPGRVSLRTAMLVKEQLETSLSPSAKLEGIETARRERFPASEPCVTRASHAASVLQLDVLASPMAVLPQATDFEADPSPSGVHSSEPVAMEMELADDISVVEVNATDKDVNSVETGARDHSRSLSPATSPTSVHKDEAPKNLEDVEIQVAAHETTADLDLAEYRDVPILDVEPASPVVETGIAAEDIHDERLSTSERRPSQSFYPQYLHPLSSPAFPPIPDDAMSNTDGKMDVDDLDYNELFQINMPSPRTMYAGLVHTPHFDAGPPNTTTTKNTGLSRLDSVESVLWSRSIDLQAEKANLKFAGSECHIIPESKQSQFISIEPHYDGMLERADARRRAHTGPVSYRPFEPQPPIPETWRPYEIFPLNQVDLKMPIWHSMTLAGVIADFGNQPPPSLNAFYQHENYIDGRASISPSETFKPT